MTTESPTQPDPPLAPLPRNFAEYLSSFGPGIVVVLTWLGAGDIIDAGIAGGNYGYALMWVMVVALVMRYLFVSLIAKYQLCNQHGESVLDGLARLHPWYAPCLAVVAVIMGHVFGSYLVTGCGAAWIELTGIGQTWQWALLWSGIALALVFHPVYARIELVFKVLLAVLAISLLGTALWVGPSLTGIARGTIAFELPEQKGEFGSLLVAASMLGAVGGSLMNLAYPYFLEQKGWRGPQYRRVQTYDFLLAVAVMIVLNLSVWTLGAELIHARGETISSLDDLTALLSRVLGEGGRVLFLVGFFAAVFTSVVGTSLVVASIASHGYLRWRAGESLKRSDYQTHPIYKVVVVWTLFTPLVWSLPGMPDVVTLTIVGNSLQVVLVPFLAGGLWWITADARFIGPKYQNVWWENLVMALLFVLALWGAAASVISIYRQITGTAGG